MPVPHDSLQLDWSPASLRARWPHGPDNDFILRRISEVVIEVAGEEGRGSVLDVGSAEAVQSRLLHGRGLSPFILDPSPLMLERAREEMQQGGARLTLVRGVSEQLPFRDESFDRVLCHSAIDHFAQPERCVEEMARVCKRSGKVVLSAVNYGSAAVLLSRLMYRIGRTLGWWPRDVNLFWDTPVPQEHTFECSYRILARLCTPHLEPDRTYGVSLGSMVPGWSALLERLPDAGSRRLLTMLDRLARRIPAVADFVVSVWRPKSHAGSAATAAQPAEPIRSRSVVYPYAIEQEARYWGMATYEKERDCGDAPTSNLAFTGDPQLTWREDLMRRGPYRTAAVLGCDEVRHDLAWLRGGASKRLDIYEVSPLVIGQVRAAFAALDPQSPALLNRARFIRTDLNVAELPAERYDVVWSSGCLHHILELEHLFAQVERALRPGGLFAFHEYVGESRRRYDPRRLELVRRALAEIPSRFYLGAPSTIGPPSADDMSPFCAIRSADVLPLARQRFDPVHIGAGGGLFPLGLFLDIDAMRRDAPDRLKRFLDAEREALDRDHLAPCAIYAVFRKRAA